MTPRTAAGRALYADVRRMDMTKMPLTAEGLRDGILAIEAQALPSVDELATAMDHVTADDMVTMEMDAYGRGWDDATTGKPRFASLSSRA